MKFRDAVNACKVRGYIARPNGYHADSDGMTKDMKFWKNHSTPLECQIAWQDQAESDWECFDPEAEEQPLTA